MPGLQLDFADAPMQFYGTSRAFGLVSDNGYMAFDYTIYPYDPKTFGADDLGSPKVRRCKMVGSGEFRSHTSAVDSSAKEAA